MPLLFTHILQGAVFAQLLNWSSLIINGIVNFIIPPILYLKAIQTIKQEKRFDTVSSVNAEVSKN